MIAPKTIRDMEEDQRRDLVFLLAREICPSSDWERSDKTLRRKSSSLKVDYTRKPGFFDFVETICVRYEKNSPDIAEAVHLYDHYQSLFRGVAKVQIIGETKYES
jgi:hypothetical protein